MGKRSFIRVLTFCAALLALALLSAAADIPCTWAGVEKTVAIGDIHGDYDNFVLILKGTGLVGDDLHWTGGKTHLVQTGDILDRGTRAKDVLDLLMRLEKEAEAAGGMVHVLLGNHEELNITGITLNYPTYVTVEQFVAFLPEKFRKAREEDYISGLEASAKARAKRQGLDLASNEVRLFWTTQIRRDDAARSAYIRGFNDMYGNWLIQKNAVIRINDIVFAHGGISEKYSTWKLQDINSTLRKELQLFQGRRMKPGTVPRAFKPEMIYAQDSPLWYRGLSFGDELATEAEVSRILANLKAEVIVVGHTQYRSGGTSPVIPDINNISQFHGKVYIIDTGISNALGGILAALIIEDSTITLWEPRAATVAGGTGVVPEETGLSTSEKDRRYLKTAAVLSVRKESVAGRTAPWKIMLENAGVIRQALFKYVSRTRPTPIPDSYKYELAAYELSEYLGLKFVPPIAEREIEGIQGTLQLFVEDTIREGDRKAQKLLPADPKAFDQAMDDLKVFENLVYDSCQNDEDTLIRKDDWKIYRVDFAQAFEPQEQTLRGCEILRCSRKLFERLLNWDQDAVKALLTPFLNGDELKALHARQGLIVSTIKKDIETRGESAVLF